MAHEKAMTAMSAPHRVRRSIAFGGVVPLTSVAVTVENPERLRGLLAVDEDKERRIKALESHVSEG